MHSYLSPVIIISPADKPPLLAEVYQSLINPYNLPKSLCHSKQNKNGEMETKHQTRSATVPCHTAALQFLG